MSEFDAINTIHDQDKMLEELWNEFADVPMDPSTECIDADFAIWKKGTEREDIWHWFDERYSKGVAHLLYHQQNDRTYTVTEYCNHCESEIEMRWNTDVDGYMAFCPVCGERLMLCDECRHTEGEGPCDYNSATDSCRHTKRSTHFAMFTSVERMIAIVNHAIDYIGECYNGRELYEELAGSLGMDDDEIIAAGFTSLKEFMDGGSDE